MAKRRACDGESSGSVHRDCSTLPRVNELFTKSGLDSLSEVSEEFDTSRWKTRFESLVAAVTGAAARREGLTEWLMVWLPAGMALQKLSVTLGSLLYSLSGALKGAENPDVLKNDVLSALREDFEDLVEAFPDASQWLLDVDELDRLIRAVVEDPTARATMNEAGTALTQLLDDVIGRMLDVILHTGESREVDVLGMTHWLENLEAIIQAALDRVNADGRLFFR